MADAPNAFDGSAAAALLTPLERTLAAALHETRAIAEKRGRAPGALSDARAVIHALARFMVRDAMPAEVDDNYAVALACATLKGAAYSRFKSYERAGIGPHEALHMALDDIRSVAPVPVPVVPVPDLRADDLVDASDAKART